MGVLRGIARGVLVALACGIVLGGVARVAMHFIAVSAGLVPAFHWSATVGIMTVFAIAALPGAVSAALTRSRWRWLPLVIVPVLLCIPATGTLGDELRGSLITGFKGWAPGRRVVAQAA